MFGSAASYGSRYTVTDLMWPHDSTCVVQHIACHHYLQSSYIKFAALPLLHIASLVVIDHFLLFDTWQIKTGNRPQLTHVVETVCTLCNTTQSPCNSTCAPLQHRGNSCQGNRTVVRHAVSCMWPLSIASEAHCVAKGPSLCIPRILKCSNKNVIAA